ncbi:hypothetical protein CEXT_604761 [Caerostris extrusa]|uniref:Uncharacterized protein n=1 Tax=Caerostris extrusa TaxID=172846 RepID=A0AAV4TZ28_CAEEX|nr:hypothetical protein CEXT_604761 [Caerostris extrusa]
MSRSTEGSEDFASQFAFISCREVHSEWEFEFVSYAQFQYSNSIRLIASSIWKVIGLHLGREVKVISRVICASLGRSPSGERKCREAPKAAKSFPLLQGRYVLNGNSNSAL